MMMTVTQVWPPGQFHGFVHTDALNLGIREKVRFLIDPFPELETVVKPMGKNNFCLEFFLESYSTFFLEPV